jgi:hypothetical protein
MGLEGLSLEAPGSALPRRQVQALDQSEEPQPSGDGPGALSRHGQASFGSG